jgi:hypothetical protein
VLAGLNCSGRLAGRQKSDGPPGRGKTRLSPAPFLGRLQLWPRLRAPGPHAAATNASTTPCLSRPSAPHHPAPVPALTAHSSLPLTSSSSSSSLSSYPRYHLTRGKEAPRQEQLTACCVDVESCADFGDARLHRQVSRLVGPYLSVQIITRELIHPPLDALVSSILRPLSPRSN